uniref:C2H2-type domain-containing protein n=1 Tax=Lates calcarifer TaxID=8187 RepID=A0A4W6CET8_LATCA
MSKVQTLRAFINQRLTAAAEEIFVLFERTIAEYEEELYCLKANHRQRELLEAVFRPEIRLHRTDVQQLLVTKEEAYPEQQEWSSSLDQEDPPETPYDDGDKAQSSQLHHRQTEEERDVEVEAGGSDPDKTLNPGTCLQPGHDKTSQDSESETDDREKPFGCSVCGKRYHQEKRHFKRSGDVGCTEEKPFSCSLCGKRFEKSYNLIAHVRVHTGEKPFTCSVCKTCFKTRHALMNHMRIHTGEKPFRCSVCGKRFVQSGSLKQHTSVHTEEKPYSCNACDKRFSLLTYLRRHKCVSKFSSKRRSRRNAC